MSRWFQAWVSSNDPRSVEQFAGTCGKKAAYKTEARAERMRLGCERRYGGALRTYHCERCGLWHLTKWPRIA